MRFVIVHYFRRYYAEEKPPCITSGIDLSRYPPLGSVLHTSQPQPDNIHNQEMLKFVRKSEIDSARYMTEQVTIEL